MDFVAGAMVLLLSCAGNTTLWVALTNRCHACPWRHSVLRRLRTIHDFGILLYPPFIIWAAGTGRYGLLNGGSVDQLSDTVRYLLFVPLAGLIPLCVSVLRWNLRRPPARLIAVSGQHTDIAASAESEHQRTEILGVQSHLARFPWNEIYELEVTHKHLQLREPKDIRGTLRIAHFSDMHMHDCPGPGFHDRVADRLCELQPDFYVFTGDLLDSNNRIPQAIELFERIASVAPGYFILGNHDWHLDHETVRAGICSVGWTDMAQKTVVAEHNGVPICVAGTEAPWIGNNPAIPAPSGESLRLLLSHTPDQRNFGSASNIDLMLCGHNHGGQVILPLIGPVYSPSRYGTRYAGGIFEYHGMLMHVSRGTGAKDPLRWNCRPELTLLEVDV